MKKQYLNNKFYTESLQVEDWNNPPDSIFDSVVAEVSSQQEPEATHQSDTSLNEKFYEESMDIEGWNNPPNHVFANTLAEVKEQRALDAQQALNDKFYNETLQVEDWNTPPDLLFKNAVTEVARKKKRKSRRIITSALLLALLVSVVGIALFVNYKLSLHNSELVQLKNELKDIKYSSNPINTDIGSHQIGNEIQSLDAKSLKLTSQEYKSLGNEGNTMSDGSRKEIAQKSDIYTSTNQASITQSTQTVTSVTGGAASISNEISNNKEGAPFATTTSMSGAVNKLPFLGTTNEGTTHNSAGAALETSATEAHTVATLESLDMLKQNQIKLFNTNEGFLELGLSLASTPEVTKEVSGNGWFLNTKAINRHSNFIMRGLPKNKDLHLTKYDEYKSSYAVELNLEKSLKNNYSIYAGVGYQKLINNSETTETLSYTSANETDTGNGFIYTENMVLDTPLGFINETVNFTTVESIEGTELSQMSQTQQQLNIINLRLGLKKRFEYKKIAVSPNVALGSNYIIQKNTSFNATIFSDNNVVQVAPMSAEDLTLLNKHFLTAELGLDVHYKISNSVSVGVNLGYEQSLTSLRKGNDGLRTYTNSLITGLSFRTSL